MGIVFTNWSYFFNNCYYYGAQMILNILFGQRKCRYSGEFAPEALEVADEFTMEENPEWIKNLKDRKKESGVFESIEILVVRVDDKAIDKCLFPDQVIVNGEVVG
jgi:hypothetical protein